MEPAVALLDPLYPPFGVQIPVLQLGGCAALGRSLCFSEPQLPLGDKKYLTSDGCHDGDVR